MSQHGLWFLQRPPHMATRRVTEFGQILPAQHILLS